MTDPTHPLTARLLPLYPVPGGLPPALLHSVQQQHTQALALPAGQPASQPAAVRRGSACQGFPMLLPGELGVVWQPARPAPALCRVRPGDLCVACAACLFGQALLVAHGHTVAPSALALLLPHRRRADRLGAHRARVCAQPETDCTAHPGRRASVTLVTDRGPRSARCRQVADHAGSACCCAPVPPVSARPACCWA